MTERQKQILSAIIEQYAEVASPVGSSLLAKLFNVSSATIRSEMAELERLGYLETQRGRGTFVSAALPTNARREREARVRDAARTLLTQAYFAGLGFQEVVQLVRETDEELTGAKHE